ncbi:MAG: hypothetical protein V1755_05755 [Chloroflexota bacterium]
MTEIIVQAVVALVQGAVLIAQQAGQKVDLSEIMATAAARAGATMQEYEKQLAAQKALFPQG